jgi:hypothetical protein
MFACRWNFKSEFVKDEGLIPFVVQACMHVLHGRPLSPFFEYKPRWITPLFRDAVGDHPIFVLTGEWYVGKSTERNSMVKSDPITFPLCILELGRSAYFR